MKIKLKKLNQRKNTESAHWMYCIIIHNLDYNNFENFMNDKLIQIRPFFYDIRKHEHLNDIYVNYEECKIIKNGVMLPSYPGLEYDKQEYISNCIKEYIKII